MKRTFKIFMAGLLLLAAAPMQMHAQYWVNTVKVGELIPPQNMNARPNQNTGMWIDNDPPVSSAPSSTYSTPSTRSNSSTSTSSSRRFCNQCAGHPGKCGTCGGRGVYNAYVGAGKSKCPVCNGTGKCRYCNGTGYQ